MPLGGSYLKTFYKIEFWCLSLWCLSYAPFFAVYCETLQRVVILCYDVVEIAQIQNLVIQSAALTLSV